jgi:tetratricopeptide (TPR) repeat protein
MIYRGLAIWLAAALALLVAWWPAAGLADATAREQAQALLKQGNTLREAGDLSGALARFEQAHDLYPSFRIDYNIGLCLVDLKQHARAATHLERFLRRGAVRSPLEMVGEARKHLAALRGKIAAVTLECDVAGAAVSVNGTRVGVTPLPGALYLDPGPHRLQVEKAGYLTERWEDRLAAGGQREVSVILRAAPPAQRVPEDRTSGSIWAYSALGVAGTLLTVGAVLYGLGFSSGDEAYDNYMEASSKPELVDRIRQHRAEIDAARTNVTIGHVFMGAAAVALGVSLYHFMARPRREQRPARVSVVPGPLGAGTGLTISGAF